jgi:predicted  nucleic acid-binding Zn-ribbon protein
LQDKLKALAELQKVDLEIASLKKSSEVYPKQIAELEKELAAFKGAVEGEQNRLTELDKQKRTLEQNIVEEKDKVKKWEQRLAEQRSTREYAALAREIDIAKKANQNMADEVVELAKQQGTAREAVKGKEQELHARIDQVSGRMGELKGKISSFDEQVKALETKRGEAAAKVDKTLLNRYETVRKKRMPALVTVNRGTCQGCNMNIPPQQYNTLCATLSTDICPNCNRIICAQEALEGRLPMPVEPEPPPKATRSKAAKK